MCVQLPFEKRCFRRVARLHRRQAGDLGVCQVCSRMSRSSMKGEGSTGRQLCPGGGVFSLTVLACGAGGCTQVLSPAPVVTLNSVDRCQDLGPWEDPGSQVKVCRMEPWRPRWPQTWVTWGPALTLFVCSSALSQGSLLASSFSCSPVSPSPTYCPVRPPTCPLTWTGPWPNPPAPTQPSGSRPSPSRSTHSPSSAI